MKKLISFALSLLLTTSSAIAATDIAYDASYQQKQNAKASAPAFNTQHIKEQIQELNKTKDFAKQSFNPILEAYALDKLGLVKGKNSREYLMAFIRFKLNQGGAARTEGIEASDKLCHAQKASFECVQSQALVEVTSSNMKMKLQPFYMHETNKDYEAAVMDIQNTFNGEPVEHNLRYRYYKMLGNIEGRENEAIVGLQRIFDEIPYETNFKVQLLKDIGTFKAQALANTALKEIDDPKTTTTAQKKLEKALNTDPSNADASYWKEILQTSKYYRTVEEGDTFLANNELDKALVSYKKAASINSKSPYAYVGLARVYTNLKDEQNFDRARAQALKASYSESNDEVIRIRQSMQGLKAQFLVDKAKTLQAQGDKNSAIKTYEEALKLDPDNPWLYYEQANLTLETLGEEKADLVFKKVHNKTLIDSEYAFAYSLYLAGKNNPEDAYLVLSPFEGQSDSIDNNLARYLEMTDIKQSSYAYEQGDLSLAISKLENVKAPYAKAQKAAYLYEDHQKQKALATYLEAITEDPSLDYATFRVAQIEQELGNEKEAIFYADKLLAKNDSLSLDNQRALANLYYELGDKLKASRVYLMAVTNQAVEEGKSTAPEEVLKLANKTSLLNPKDLITKDAEQNRTKAWILANLANIQKEVGSSDEDLSNTYRTALAVYEGKESEYNDNGEYTHALLTSDEKEDWLKESLKSNGSEYYQRNNIILTEGIRFLRDSGHSGYSDNKGFVNMLNLSFPAFSGRVQVQMDTTSLDPGSLSGQEYEDMFGTCFVSGCKDTSSQKKSNHTFGVAYDNELFHLDLGTAPKVSNNSFKNNDIVGGATLYLEKGDWTFKPSVFRRAKENSVLSYFGQRDPNTGIAYGAVKRTGVSLSTSYFINDDSGIWSNAYLESLKGKNIEDNYDVTIMAGYYHHIYNQKNERVTLSPSIMFMHYDKDLSDYTFSQGGYYSPQTYLSGSLSLRYLRRHENTSYMVELSGSISYAKTNSSERYPLKSMISPYNLDDLYAQNSSDSSVSFGGGIKFAIEQRLSSHLVVGAAFDATKSEDYSPVNGVLYFRWFFEKWNGDLNMPPQGPTAIVQW